MAKLSVAVLAVLVASAQAHTCDCHGASCQCCAKVDISIIKLDDVFCANLNATSKGPNEVEVVFQITETEPKKNKTRVVYTKVLDTVQNAELGCAKIPLPLPLSLLKPEVCAELGRVTANATDITGCLELEFKADGDDVGDTSLGCFDLKPAPSSVVQGGAPAAVL